MDEKQKLKNTQLILRSDFWFLKEKQKHAVKS